MRWRASSFSFSISAASALSSAWAALTSLSRASALTISSRILSSLAGDFFFRELDLVEESFVLLVGLYVEGLVAILGNLAAQLGDIGVELAAGGFVGFDGGLGLFELGFGAGQLLFDHGDAFGKFGDFVLQTADFLVRVLQFQQIFYFWKHPAALILARGKGAILCRQSFRVKQYKTVFTTRDTGVHSGNLADRCRAGHTPCRQGLWPVYTLSFACGCRIQLFPVRSLREKTVLLVVLALACLHCCAVCRF